MDTTVHEGDLQGLDFRESEGQLEEIPENHPENPVNASAWSAYGVLP